MNFKTLKSAAISGNIHLTKFLLEQGYNPSQRVSSGTLLQFVIQHNFTDIAILLMEYGAEVNTQDKFRNTPLHEAAKNGNKVLVEELLAKGANPFIYGENGMTPQMLAGQHNHKELAFRLSDVFLSNYPNLFFSLNSLHQKNKNEWLDLSNHERPLDLSIKSCLKK